MIRLLQHQHGLTAEAVCVDLQQDRDAMPGTAGRPQSPEPRFSHSETAACPGRRATAAVRCRIVCPQAYARRATAASCRWVRRPMRRAWDGGIFS
ncbi:MAG: hypothetical protein ACRDPY_35775, partial [Streptosporangiaceae bacterium]